MSNRKMRRLTGSLVNKKGRPQVLRVPRPWSHREPSPTYSEAKNPVRRFDKSEALRQGVPYNRRFKKRQKKERIKRALQEQASGG